MTGWPGGSEPTRNGSNSGILIPASPWFFPNCRQPDAKPAGFWVLSFVIGGAIASWREGIAGQCLQLFHCPDCGPRIEVLGVTLTRLGDISDVFLFAFSAWFWARPGTELQKRSALLVITNLRHASLAVAFGDELSKGGLSLERNTGPDWSRPDRGFQLRRCSAPVDWSPFATDQTGQSDRMRRRRQSGSTDQA